MNIALIGYRGSGKTTVARELAARLDWSWVDADDEIERRAGKSIARIFADDGETAFRDLESQVLAELAPRARCVIALGGGAVARTENRQLLRQVNQVVWLEASPETLWGRIERDQATSARRPNLTAQGGITEIIATLAARRAAYSQCANLRIDTEEKTPAQIADAILAQLQFGPNSFIQRHERERDS